MSDMYQNARRQKAEQCGFNYRTFVARLVSRKSNFDLSGKYLREFRLSVRNLIRLLIESFDTIYTLILMNYNTVLGHCAVCSYNTRLSAVCRRP